MRRFEDTETGAAGLHGLMGVFEYAATTMSGWLSDRWDSRWAFVLVL